VLEVKLEIAEGMSTPPWVKEMLASGMAAEVYKFSKFIHGCAILMQDDVQVIAQKIRKKSKTGRVNTRKEYRRKKCTIRKTNNLK